MLAAPEQLKFLATVDYRLANALSLGLARRDQPSTVIHSAGWLLNAKGVAQQALTESPRLDRDADNPTQGRRGHPPAPSGQAIPRRSWPWRRRRPARKQNGFANWMN